MLQAVEDGWRYFGDPSIWRQLCQGLNGVDPCRIQFMNMGFLNVGDSHQVISFIPPGIATITPMAKRTFIAREWSGFISCDFDAA
ncbi:MAG: hypothetical protein ACKOA0_05340, partial [Burkholderiaceae bacterium]